jgi:hypothetical protein
VNLKTLQIMGIRLRWSYKKRSGIKLEHWDWNESIKKYEHALTFEIDDFSHEPRVIK